MPKQNAVPAWVRHAAVLGLYAGLTLLLTWPLILRLATHIPGAPQWAFDESTFIWNIWYFKHAAVDSLTNPLHSELIYYPLGIDLILYTYNFFHALAAQPLALAVNLPFGSNVALLFSTVLSGYGAFLLVRYLLAPDPATGIDSLRGFFPPLVAGLLYAFASNRAIYAALGHYDMVTTQWIPFYALTLLQSLNPNATNAQRRKSAALAGFFFALNGLAEMITALFLAIFTLIVALVYLLQESAVRSPKSGDRSRKAEGSGSRGRLDTLLSSFVIIGIVGALVWGPVLVPILYQFLTDDFALKGWGEAIPLSTDLLGWFTPTILHPLFGGDLVAELRRVQLRALEGGGETGFRDVNTVFLGWVSLALALVGALAFWKRVRIWIWTSIVFGLFTLGPFLQINGQYRFDLDGVEATFPMPYALLHYLPIIKANRAPNRNSVLLMLGLAVLAGYGVYWLLGWLNRLKQDQDRTRTPRAPYIALTVILAALILFEHLTIPAPLSDARIPAVYTQIAADPAPVSVMHLPLGWRNSFGTAQAAPDHPRGPERTLLQYYQTAHGKPMLGGNISRAPDFKMDYFTRIPFFATLIDVQAGVEASPEAVAAAQAAADELMYLYNVGYVLLMPPIPQRFPYTDTWEDAWRFAKETLPLESEPFWIGDGIEAYRVVQPGGSDAFALDLGAPETFPYRGEGWDSAETDAPYDTTAIWATEPASRLFIPLRDVDPAATYQVRLRVHPFVSPQSLALHVNEYGAGEQALADGWQTLTWEVPGSALVDSLNRLELAWAQTAQPCQINPASCTIGNTGVRAPIDIELNGFADGGFIALFDADGNQTDASAGRRGVNVTVLDPGTGEVLEMRGFDTAANEFESAALADYLTSIEPGRIVLLVSQGNATAYLTEDAVAGFRNLGADVTLDGLRDHYFAMAGVQGADAGTAAVEIGPEGAYLPIRPDRRSLAAAVDWVEIRQ